MNRVPQSSNAGGNDQDKNMKTPQYDLNDFIFLLPDTHTNTNIPYTNDNNILTTTNTSNTNNNMIKPTSMAGLITSSSLESNLPISAVPESEGWARVKRRNDQGQTVALPLSPPLPGNSNVLSSRPIYTFPYLLSA